MQQSFGFANLWAQGDLVSHAVTVFLLLMSLASWIVILLKSWDLIQVKKAAHGAEHQFWHAETYEEGLEILRHPANNPFLALAVSGKDAAAHHRNSRPQLHDAMDISDWITRGLKSNIDESVAKMQSGLAVLASVGSTAPFVGLLGTVWGIYNALISIGAAGEASIDKVAGPVGEALIMTALGLAVAIPAVLGYNALTRGNKGVISKLHRFAHDLHAYFLTGARVSSDGSKPAGPKIVTRN